MKIITSASALEHLGPDFSFVTRVGLCGDSLVIIGSGDPLFGDPENGSKESGGIRPILEDVVDRLKAAGIVSISSIFLDTSVFDDQRVHPSWPRNQLHQKYACEVSGLNFAGNCVKVAAVNRSGRAVLTLDPPTDYVRLINGLSTGRSRRSWLSVARTDVPCQLLVRGNCRTAAGPSAVAIENPALYFGSLLRQSLRSAGISLTGQVLESPAPEGCEFQPIVEYVTPLAECLRRTNKDSLGLAAEALLKTLGAWSSPDGKQGSFEGGSRVLAEDLWGLGVDEKEFVIADGSGLSRDNRLSANALVQVLVHLSAGPNWQIFKNSLAVGGLDGTIENHFWERKYRGRILAKSGYIQAVRALSGVVETDTGEYVFSFLANRAGSGARTAIDNAVKAVVDWGNKTAS
jgi:D-alanyl-D-alanine carboxypeptidase/D-alanyl-D-alanine-endopeptidase (penicillin-binding protein 4)